MIEFRYAGDCVKVYEDFVCVGSIRSGHFFLNDDGVGMPPELIAKISCMAKSIV